MALRALVTTLLVAPTFLAVLLPGTLVLASGNAESIEPALLPTEVSEFMSRARVGGTIYLAPGEFELPGTLELENPVRIIGSVHGTTLWTAAPTRGAVIRFSGAEGFGLENLTILHPGASGSHAIDVSGGTIDFRRVTVIGPYEYVDVDDAGAAINLHGTVRGLIIGSVVMENPGGGIALHGDARVVLRDNHVVDNGGVGVSFGGNAGGTAIENRVEANWENGINVADDARPTIVGNHLLENSLAGIEYADAAGGDFARNLVEWNVVGVSVTGNAAPNLLGNAVRSHPMPGVLYVGAGGGAVTDNVLELNAIGIELRGSSNPLVSLNTIRENNGPGVLCADASHAEITNNRLEENLRSGIGLTTTAACTVNNNQFSGNVKGDFEFDYEP